MPRNDDMSLILAKAKRAGFFEDVKDFELDFLTQEARNLFSKDVVSNYNSSRNIYNLQPKHLRKTRFAIAKAKQGLGFFRLGTYGDSTVMGLSVNTATESWPAQLRSLLVSSGIPSAGTGIVHAWNGVSSDPRWTYNSWSSYSNNSPLRKNQSGTDTLPLVFASEVSGTIARVYYTNGSSSFTVSIDGGAAVQINPPGGAAIVHYEVTGLANTTHTISIAKVATAGNVYIAGAEVRSNATSGLILDNGGVSGIWANNLAKATFYNMNFATAEYPDDLIIIRCQTNNTGNTTVAQYRTDMDSAITAAKSGGADVVLMTAIPSGGKDFTDTTKVLYELADLHDIPLIDHLDRWGDYATTSANGFMVDTLHPNKAGYADEALSVFQALELG